MMTNLITGLIASESAFNIFVGRTLEQLNLLLTAPAHEPDLIWLMIPLLFTLLVMTFYFGIYRREELGWNTSLGNSIVLMFVALDLIRQIYHYTPTPDVLNYIQYPIQTTLVLIIFVEAMILFLFAFYHLLPKKVMYFISSPLPVNLQAYIIMAIVYTRFIPNWYMLSAALIAFFLLYFIVLVLKHGESFLVHKLHLSKLAEAKALREEGLKLRRAAKRLKGDPRKQAMEKAKDKLLEAKRTEDAVIAAEKVEFGEVRVAEGLLKRFARRKVIT